MARQPGDVVGRLTLVRIVDTFHAGKRKVLRRIWECRCSCGTTCRVRENHFAARVRNGKSNPETRSCGCLMREGRFTRQGFGWVNSIKNSYKHHARQRGHAWDLTWEQVRDLLRSDCTYCGAAPSKRPRGYPSVLLNGIDRVDNTAGYSTANVVACCTDCNIAKGEKTAEEFLAWGRRIAAHQAKPEEIKNEVA